MFKNLQNPTALIGRILLAAMFIPAGLSKIAGFAGTAAYISSVGLPWPEACAALAILIEVGAGAALLVGYQTRSAAFLLAGFTLVAGSIFHAFWSAPVDAVMITQIMFMKNVAIAGGLFMITAFGPGAISVDRQ